MKPYYTRVLIRDTNGGILVVVHCDRKVALPGGKIEDGEDPEAAAYREVREETGIIVTAMTKVHEGTYEFSTGIHRGVFYEATSWLGTAQNREPTKLNFVGFVPEAFLLASQHERLTDTLKAACRG
jgi:8-oxo-dGTP pyrophosphatase MutT (NUDIX family)